ncbi:hypothetical protein BgAZ_404030 [Babesia gibsoni]|uniref:Splicing factor Cactin n=1 Tax=Babesia gibsoni TaxID=33632 RepID=A0AAD8LMY6_BABGI|nr:hypothetical protein BgAZ_404030 [Babesia gibsoni]
MGKIPVQGQVCGKGTSGGSAAEAGRDKLYSRKETPTVCFKGSDGKFLTFVRAAEPEDASKVAGASPSATQPLWKKRRLPESKGGLSEEKEEPIAGKPSNNGGHNVAGSTGNVKLQKGNDNIAKPVPHPSQGKETDESENYFQKEDQFMFKQELEKSKLRMKDGRGNELDHLLTDGMSHAPPRDLFKGASNSELRGHLELIKAQLNFARDENFVFFLKAVETILNSRLSGDKRNGEVSEFVENKIDEILSTKSLEELKGYEVEIMKKLDSDEIVDTNFWELTLSKIPFFKACCIIEEYKKGSKQLTSQRPSIKETISKKPAEPVMKEDPAYDRFMKSLKLEEDEHLMKEDVPYGNSTGVKPRFVVRVTSGFEWNQYNLSHFNVNNPPMKHIQGFKFNIFYSELEGSGTTPKWNLVKDGDSKDSCLIVFKGGKSYSPLAFRIPNREWDTEHSRGFKNFFSNGVLHLYFTYRKLVYRR